MTGRARSSEESERSGDGAGPGAFVVPQQELHMRICATQAFDQGTDQQYPVSYVRFSSKDGSHMSIEHWVLIIGYSSYPSPTNFAITSGVTPVVLKPPSWKRFCMVTNFVRSL